MEYPARLINADGSNFSQLRQGFRWQIPEYFNIAHAVCDRHTTLGNQVALYCETAVGFRSQYTFGEIKELSNRLASALSAMGVSAGDRVGIILSQRVETSICHLAVWKLGAISLPLSVLFGSEALRYRLLDSGARVVIASGQSVEVVRELMLDLPELEQVIDCDRDRGGFWSRVEKGSPFVQVARTRCDDPALIIYTSGTTGPPKGAVLAHRCLLGNLPGFEMSQNFFPRDRDLMWTPADWAWTGGLLDALIPSWYYGCPVLGYDGGRFDAEQACKMIARYQVRNAFIPPTALKLMRQVGDLSAMGIQLRSVMSAGESLGAQLYEWATDVLGIKVNEMWGQTEFNYIVGNCSEAMRVKPGSIGKAYPGHRVEPLDEDGNVLADGEVGNLCALRDDPVMFLGYWRREQATRDKFVGKWWNTGDAGYRDEDGFLWFVGRTDDIISSAGHRIGPGEIEDCILKHPAVVQAAAVGSPDELRGEIVKAFIILQEGVEESDTLREDIQNTVRRSLATYEYPREIEFVRELPLTTTGKVRRMELREMEQRRKSAVME